MGKATAFLFPISGVVFLPPFSGGQPEALARLERHGTRALREHLAHPLRSDRGVAAVARREGKACRMSPVHQTGASGVARPGAMSRS